VAHHDIDTLNALALAGEPDVAKVSFHAFGHLRERYALLHSGGALGRGCGPLVVVRGLDGSRGVGANGATDGEPFLAGLRVAIPGRLTTAALLLRLYAPELVDPVVLTYDRIMPAVAAGEVDAGLIIHESRFTYPQFGLSCLVDLGEWWERTTGHPIPLGGIVVRRDLGRERAAAIDAAVAASLAYARGHPGACAGRRSDVPQRTLHHRCRRCS
jgi:1,4-dihydroxy-6-naphthoate synthase